MQIHKRKMFLKTADLPRKEAYPHLTKFRISKIEIETESLMVN
jgi:hypothetical protein